MSFTTKNNFIAKSTNDGFLNGFYREANINAAHSNGVPASTKTTTVVIAITAC